MFILHILYKSTHIFVLLLCIFVFWETKPQILHKNAHRAPPLFQTNDYDIQQSQTPLNERVI